MKLGLAGPFATSIHVLGGWAGTEKDPAVSSTPASPAKSRQQILLLQ